jgi:hypothetical protein
MIRTYGPSVDRWPAASINPALDLMQASTAAQDLFAEVSASNIGRLNQAETWSEPSVAPIGRGFH